MSDYLGIILDNMMAYIFGNNLYMGIFILIVLNVLMFKLNLSLDGMIVIDVPFILIFGLSALGWIDTWSGTIVILVLGLLLSYFVITKILRR